MRTIANTKVTGDAYCKGTYVENCVHDMSHGYSMGEKSLDNFHRKPYESMDNSKIKVRRRLKDETVKQ